MGKPVTPILPCSYSPASNKSSRLKGPVQRSPHHLLKFLLMPWGSTGYQSDLPKELWLGKCSSRNPEMEAFGDLAVLRLSVSLCQAV